jgi:hypothetical protein
MPKKTRVSVKPHRHVIEFHVEGSKRSYGIVELLKSINIEIGGIEDGVHSVDHDLCSKGESLPRFKKLRVSMPSDIAVYSKDPTSGGKRGGPGSIDL